MTLSEQLYNEIAATFKSLLSEEIDKGIVTISVPPYKDYFLKDGAWDKRRKYFTFKIKIKKGKKSENSIIDLGKSLVKIGTFMQDNNDEKIYIQSDFYTSNQYSDSFNITLKFIPYDLAAKILLNQ